MKNGRIPPRMTAYLRPEKAMLGDGQGSNWWSFPTDRRETPGFSKFKACAAFVVPSDSEAFNKSALDWACGGVNHPVIQKTKDVVKVEFDNKPFTNLRWVGIDSRTEGGVAYKVVMPGGWLVDLREDVMLDCLFEGAITSKHDNLGNGTYLTAQFVWAVLGSQSRLVRVGSKTYNEIMESEDRRAMQDIPEANLELGGIYENRQGKKYVVIAKGNQKGRKILTQELRRDCWDEKRTQPTDQQAVDWSIEALDKPNVYPYWHWSGSLKVVRQVGKVKVSEGLGEAYDYKVGAVRNTATAWNEATSR